MKDRYDFSKGKRGALISTKGKTLLHIYIDDEVMEGLRQQAEQAGTGYQTLVNKILHDHLNESEKPTGSNTQTLIETSIENDHHAVPSA